MTDQRQTEKNVLENKTEQTNVVDQAVEQVVKQESEQEAEQENQPETARWVILSFFAGLIVAALTLEYYGYIVHPNKNDQAIINQLKLLSLKPEFDIKVSSKASGKESLCVNGYLLLRPTNGKSVAGIVVDEKNRPIVCNLVAPESETKIEAGTEQANATDPVQSQAAQ